MDESLNITYKDIVFSLPFTLVLLRFSKEEKIQKAMQFTIRIS